MRITKQQGDNGLRPPASLSTPNRTLAIADAPAMRVDQRGIGDLT